MTQIKFIDYRNIDAVIFDFDGVLTDGNVYIDQDGKELVCCSRGDGLAFDTFRNIGLPTWILSTESNTTVRSRATKLNVPVIQNSKNKSTCLAELSQKEQLELQNVVYVGNDLNDLLAMKMCGYRACPINSHERIKQISNILLNTIGGKGVARELVESVFGIDIVKVLYDNRK